MLSMCQPICAVWVLTFSWRNLGSGEIRDVEETRLFCGVCYMLSLPAAAAAAAESLQSCPTLCDPIDGSPRSSPVPGILQARTLEWVAISSSNAWKWKVKVKSLSRVQLFSTPWTPACQAPPSMGFSRQECWSGLPSPSPVFFPRSYSQLSPSVSLSFLSIFFYFPFLPSFLPLPPFLSPAFLSFLFPLLYLNILCFPLSGNSSAANVLKL